MTYVPKSKRRRSGRQERRQERREERRLERSVESGAPAGGPKTVELVDVAFYDRSGSEPIKRVFGVVKDSTAFYEVPPYARYFKVESYR